MKTTSRRTAITGDEGAEQVIAAEDTDTAEAEEGLCSCETPALLGSDERTRPKP